MKKQFKPKIKEVWRKEATIKIKTLLEVTENPKGTFTNKEKLTNVVINQPIVNISAGFEISKKGTKELLKFIKQELYLK